MGPLTSSPTASAGALPSPTLTRHTHRPRTTFQPVFTPSQRTSHKSMPPPLPCLRTEPPLPPEGNAPRGRSGPFRTSLTFQITLPLSFSLWPSSPWNHSSHLPASWGHLNCGGSPDQSPEVGRVLSWARHTPRTRQQDPAHQHSSNTGQPGRSSPCVSACQNSSSSPSCNSTDFSKELSSHFTRISATLDHKALFLSLLF